MSQYLTQDQLRIADFEGIRDCSKATIELVKNTIADGQFDRPFADDIYSKIAEIAEGNPKLASLIMRQIIWFNSVSDQSSTTVEKIVQDLGEELSGAGWTDVEITLWKENAKLLGEISNTELVQSASKAVGLSYDYVNICRQTKILTDVRPVYNDDGTEVKSAIVSYCIRAQYDSSDGLQDIAIMMEDHEIKSLKEQCEKALVKGQTVEAFLQDKGGIPVKISGSNS